MLGFVEVVVISNSVRTTAVASSFSTLLLATARGLHGLLPLEPLHLCLLLLLNLLPLSLLSILACGRLGTLLAGLAFVGLHRLLAVRDRRLVFELSSEGGERLAEFHLSMGPFRQVVKDYFQICESYFDAVKRLPPAQIEAIDMARRGIHNEGARTLQERLDGKATVDIDTSRRLFTLICALVAE